MTAMENTEVKRAEEYAAKLWDLANAITAFVAVQAIAALLFIGQHHSVQVAAKANRCIVLAVVLVFHVVYGIGIWGCYHFQRRLLSSSDKTLNSMLCKTACGRIAVVVIFAVTLLGFFAFGEPTPPARPGG